MLRRFFLFAPALSAALAVSIGSALPASAATQLAASWAITYYANPMGVPYATVCVNFTKTGVSQGVSSGTWTSPSISGWSGSYVQRGDHFSWYGTYAVNGKSYATFDVGDLINGVAGAESSAGSFALAPSGATTVFTGTAILQQVKRCS